MKKVNYILSFLCFLMLVLSVNTQYSCKNGAKEKRISISGAFALYPMAIKWAEEYKKINPDIQIDISAGGAGKGMADALSQMVDLGMISRNISKEETAKGAWPIAVVKDAVVATMNSANPVSNTIKTRGIKKEEFIALFINETITKWSFFTKEKNDHKINIYSRSDACGAAEIWAKYLDKRQENIAGIGVFGDPGMADAVKRDEFGLGYNNINYAYDNNTRKPHEQLTVIPIDINGNGQIDTEESFYNNITDLTYAIKHNIYPSPPARELYFVSGNQPKNPEIIKFLKWILSDGQKFVKETGYVELSSGQIKNELAKLNDN